MNRVVLIGIWATLVTAVLSLPLKYVLGSAAVGAAIPTAITILMFLGVAVAVGLGVPFRTANADVVAMLMLAYGMFQAVYALVIGVEPFRILVAERIYFLPLMLYFVVRMYLQRTRGMIGLLRCVKFVILVCVVEFIYEYVAIRFIGLDYRRVIPWVDVYVKEAGGSEVFLRQYMRIWFYVPTLFGVPHSVGFLAAAGVPLFYASARYSGRRLEYVWVLILIGAVIASFSRAPSGALLVVLAAIFLRFWAVRADQFLACAGVAIALLFAIVAFDLGRSYFGTATINQTVAFFTPIAPMHLRPSPSGSGVENAFLAIFGAGLDATTPGSVQLRQGMEVPSFFGIEIRLLHLWFELGLVYLVLWLAFAWELAKGYRAPGCFLLSLALVPFFVSMVHYLEFGKFGVTQIFSLMLAIVITQIELLREPAGPAVLGRATR